jgi:hypothetical protein
MKTYVKYSILALAALLVLSLVVCGGMSLPARAGVVTVTVSGSSFTSTYAGACEGGCRFDVNELVDSNVTSIRLWGGMARWEYEDDDGVYGSPSIAQIEADPNAVNWAWWDNAMTNPPNGSDYWMMTGAGDLCSAQVSAADIFGGLKANGIMPLVTLRPTNNYDMPAWAQELNPPNSTDDWNEWWEHVFAVVYWLNVRNDYQVDDWQVHNEPDNSSQGWGGTAEDYYLLAEYMVDAIDHVYSTYLPGRTYHIYAPVGVNTGWQEEVLTNIPDLFDVMDFHTYDSDISGKINQTNNNIAQYGGGRTYPLDVSEWGNYRDAYDSVSYGVKNIAANIVRSARAEWLTRGTHIFSMYNWGDSDRWCRGLIDDDGTRRDGYYGFRLAARGVGGARTGYETTADSAKFIVATTVDDGGAIYVTMVNIGVGATVNVDVSALISSGTATHWEYSASNMDVVVGNPTVSNGLVTINVPSTSASLLVIGGGSPPPTDTPAPPPTDTPEPGPTDTPAPATDTPEPGVMHVGDIAMSCSQQGPFYKSVATVTILDVDDQPVDLATVFGTFSGATSDSVSGDTGDDGAVALESSKVKNGGTWTFTVDDVVKSGWTYDTNANVETSDSITCP